MPTLKQRLLNLAPHEEAAFRLGGWEAVGILVRLTPAARLPHHRGGYRLTAAPHWTAVGSLPGMLIDVIGWQLIDVIGWQLMPVTDCGFKVRWYGPVSRQMSTTAPNYDYTHLEVIL